MVIILASVIIATNIRFKKSKNAEDKNKTLTSPGYFEKQSIQLLLTLKRTGKPSSVFLRGFVSNDLPTSYRTHSRRSNYQLIKNRTPENRPEGTYATGSKLNFPYLEPQKLIRI